MMFLIDSNLIIYSIKEEYPQLPQFIEEYNPSVSAVSYVEVLGYHALKTDEREEFEAFFADSPLLPVSQSVILEATRLRQSHKMSLGDALIAATALIHDMTLATANTDDFDWIADLTLVNPLDS